MFATIFSSSIALSPESLATLFRLRVGTSTSLQTFTDSSGLQSSSTFTSTSLVVTSVSTSSGPRFTLV